LALPTNNEQSWKGLPETNTPAYYKHLQIADVKSFIASAKETISSTNKLHIKTVKGGQTKSTWDH
jgi:hypothetical protein